MGHARKALLRDCCAAPSRGSDVKPTAHRHVCTDSQAARTLQDGSAPQVHLPLSDTAQPHMLPFAGYPTLSHTCMTRSSHGTTASVHTAEGTGKLAGYLTDPGAFPRRSDTACANAGGTLAYLQHVMFSSLKSSSFASTGQGLNRLYVWRV